MEGTTSPEVMRKLADQAVAQARSGFSAKLDYTARSIKTLEAALQNLHGHLKSPQSSWTPAQYRSFSLMYGAYLGEVVKAQCGGDWKPSSLDQPVFEVSGMTLHPTEKILKRLQDGPDDHIPSYFEGVVNAIVPAMRGEPAPRSVNALADQPALATGFVRILHSSKAYSVGMPNAWKRYEKNNNLAAYPPDGHLLVTFVGNKGWIPFKQFVEVSITKPFQAYTARQPPRDIDGRNLVG